MAKNKLLTLIVSICLVLLFVGLSLVAACAAPTPTPTPEAKTLRIGALFSLTGWFSPFDTISNDIAEITRDIINEQGGVVVNGQPYKIELIVEDFKSTMDGVTAGANKLVYDEGVKFMISPSAYFTAATAPICEPNKVLRVQMFNAYLPGELDNSTTYAFLCNNGAVEQNIAAITYMAQTYPNIKTVCSVSPVEAVDGILPVAEKILKEHGITLIGEPITFVSSETVDFTALATKAIHSEADAIYFCMGLVTHAGPLLKSVREQGSDMYIGATIGASAVEIMRISGEEAATNFSTVGLMPYPPNAPPLMTEIMDRYYAKRGLEAGIQLESANCLWELKQAIEKAQSFDTTVVRDTWEKMETFDSPFGTAHLGGLETYGIKHAVSHPDTISILDNHEVKFGSWVDVRVP
jgi:ABC-type branched-subunit amino acid transport system substrate-binding protein